MTGSIALVPLVTAGAAAFVATRALAQLALRYGWIDRRDGIEAARKPREAPVPPVGGVAIVLCASLASLLSAGLAFQGWTSAVEWTRSVPWPAFVAALALGAWDDRQGLEPLPKVLGQTGVAALLAMEIMLKGGDGVAAGVLACAVLVAINVLNTWDHADGFAGSCAAIGLWGSVPGAACLGFLPWNTVLRRRRGGESVPWAYLGDGGSHALGVLFAAHPAAWPVLVVPLADLARVVVLRIAAGQGPWVGDRRHLGQRLERAGWAPSAGAAAAATCVLPAAWMGAGGALIGVALYLLLLAGTRQVKIGADPQADDSCDGPVADR